MRSFSLIVFVALALPVKIDSFLNKQIQGNKISFSYSQKFSKNHEKFLMDTQLTAHADPASSLAISTTFKAISKLIATCGIGAH